MRKKQTFLITVLASEDQHASFCGKIKVVGSGETRIFTNMEELNQFIFMEMDPANAQKPCPDQAPSTE